MFLKRVIAYTWHIITKPFRFWWWCFDHYSFFLSFGSMVFAVLVIVAPVVMLIENHRAEGLKVIAATEAANEATKKAAQQRVLDECERKGGVYAFIVKVGETSSSWACIDARRIELDSQESR